MNLNQKHRIVGNSTIIQSNISDAHLLSNRLKISDIDELHHYNAQTALDALESSFSSSKMCFTLLDDRGVTQAMFGVCWTPNPRVGKIWILSTNYIGLVSRSFLKYSGEYIEYFLNGHDLIFNHVHSSNVESIRWLEWIGFEKTKEVISNQPGNQVFFEYCKFSSPEVRALYIYRNWKKFVGNSKTS